MQYKNNKKGVKLLAAVMAFAMVFVAAFALIGTADESEANPITATGVLEPSSSTVAITAENQSTYNGKSYLIKEDTSISFTGTTSGTCALSLYVISGKTVTITGVGSNVATIDVYAVIAGTTAGEITADKIANVMVPLKTITSTTAFEVTATATAGTSASGDVAATNGEGKIEVTTHAVFDTDGVYVYKIVKGSNASTTFASLGGISGNTITGDATADLTVTIVKETTNVNMTFKNGGSLTNYTNILAMTDVTIGADAVVVELAARGTGTITLDANGTASNDITAGKTEVTKGSITFDDSNGFIFGTNAIFSGVLQGDSSTTAWKDLTAASTVSSTLDGNETIINKNITADVILASTHVLTVSTGASFTGKVSDDATATSSVEVIINTLPSGSSVAFTLSSGDVQVTPTATTIKAANDTTVIGSYLKIKSVLDCVLNAGADTKAIELADGFNLTPASNAATTLTLATGSNGIFIIPKGSTITLGNASGQIAALSATKIYVFGTIDGSHDSGKLVGTNVYYTAENKAAVLDMKAGAELAVITTMSGDDSFYTLSQAQAAGYDISTVAITFSSADVYTTDDGAIPATGEKGVNIDLSSLKATITPGSSGTKIHIVSGTTFTISNETVLKKDSSSTYALSMKIEAGSELVIKDSNILMEVTKDARADVKVSAKTMELTNPSGSIEVGYMREAIVSGDINGSTVSVYGNMTIAGTAKISSGSTMEIYKGGNLNVEGELTVEGTVNFNKESSGTISGTMTIGMPNAGATVNVVRSDVTITETGTVKVVAPNAKGISEGRTNTLDISASVTPVYNGVIGAVTTPSPDGKLDNTPYMFTVLGNLEMNGTLKADDIYDKGTVTINGTVANFKGYDAGAMDTAAITAGTSKVTIFDGVSITLTSVTGTLSVVDTNIMAEAERPQAKLSSGNSVTVQNVKGVTVSEAVSSKTYTSSGTNYRVYVSDMTVAGTFSAATESGTRSVTLAGTPTAYYGDSIYGKILISDDVIVGKNVTLTSSANVEMSGTITVVADGATLSLTNGMMNVTGTITVKTGSQLANPVSTTSESYISAAKSYVLDAATAVYTYTYTTFENAIATVLSAENKTVEVLGYVTVSKSTDIPADAIVVIEKTLTIGKDADVVAKQKSNISGDKISVSGSFTAEDYINDLAVDEVIADVVSTKDAARTWTSLAKALEGAGEGSVITASTDMTLGSVTIPAGVTVNTEYNITVKKNSVITVDGTLNVTKGTITQNSASAPDVKGSLVLGEKGVVAVVDAEPEIYADVAGAHFQKLVGAKDYYFVTNVAYAAANADAKVVGGNIDIYGEVAMGDVTFTKAADADSLTVRLIKTTDADLKTAVSGNVKLAKGAAFIAGDNVFFTGSVAVDEIATIAFQKAEGISIAKYTDNAASTPVEYALIDTNSAKGAMTFQSGTATIGTGALTTGAIVTSADFVVTVGKDATLVVPQNGTVTVGAITKAETASFVVEGTLDVVKGKVTVNGTMDVIGTVNISQTSATNGVQVSGTGILNVLGTVNVSKESTKDGTLKVSGVIAVGSKPTALGAAGTVNGIITTGSNDGYVKVYSGSVETVKVNGLDAEPTVININGKVYMTLLGNGDVQTILESEKIELDGVEKYTSDVKIYSDEAMTKEINSFNIGDYEIVYFELDTAKADVYISVGNYITLWIDGERYNTSSNYPVKITVGTHDIKVLIDPNYEGTTTITFNGQTITNGKLVITTDMVGEKNVLSAVGDVKYVPTETPTEESGMGITDYLLIVLVILAAILVVVVAIRMMRS